MRESEGNHHPALERDMKVEGILRVIESGEGKLAVDSLRGMVNDLKTHSPEEAVILAEKIAESKSRLPKEQQEHLDNVLGEAYLHASDFDKAETAFGTTAKADLQKFPEDEKKITPELKDAWSRTIHAQGRLADVAFHSGNYATASERFKQQIETQELSPVEPVGPRACALYGQAASEFMKDEGDIANVLDMLSTAKALLHGVQGEDTLNSNIDNLIAAAEAMDRADDEEQKNRRQHMHEAIKNQDGGKKGVKHMNFSELHDNAVNDLGNAQEEEE